MKTAPSRYDRLAQRHCSRNNCISGSDAPPSNPPWPPPIPSPLPASIPLQRPLRYGVFQVINSTGKPLVNLRLNGVNVETGPLFFSCSARGITIAGFRNAQKSGSSPKTGEARERVNGARRESSSCRRQSALGRTISLNLGSLPLFS